MFARKNFPVIILAAVLVIVVAILALTKNPQQPVQQNSQSTKNVEKSVTLQLSPAQSLIAKGKEETISVNIDSPKDEVTGVQLVITYDPKVLTIKEISPATYMNEPTVLLKEIDNNAGRALYALGSFKPKGGTGPVATIQITGVSVGKSTLSLSQGSKIAVKNSEVDNLKQAEDATIEVK